MAAGARRACGLARRRDRVCKRRGAFAGNRLQGRVADRSWAEGAPKCAEGGALSHRPRVRACGPRPTRMKAARSPRGSAWREAPMSGRRRPKGRAEGGGPAGAAERGGTEPDRRPLTVPSSTLRALPEVRPAGQVNLMKVRIAKGRRRRAIDPKQAIPPRWGDEMPRGLRTGRVYCRAVESIATGHSHASGRET